MDQPTPKEPRGSVSLRIKFRSATLDQFIERYGVDVSRGGIFIRTREPLAVGTQLRFDFQLQDAAPLLAGEGTVVWIRENDPTRAGVTPGMGVRFDKLTPTSQPTLEKILAEKGRREQAGVPPKPSPSLAVRRPSSTFSALDPAAQRAAHPAPASGPPRVGGLSPLGAQPPAPPPGAAPAAPQPATGSGRLRTGAQAHAAAPAAGVPMGAAPRDAQAPTGSGPLSSRPRTSEQGVPAGIPTLESSGAFGRPRTTGGMSAQRPAPAPAALFEKPTADDIDRALSVLTEVDGPVPEPVAAPVDFSARTRKATDAQPIVVEASPDVGDAPRAAHRRDTDAQPMVVESMTDVGDAPSRRPGTGTRPLFSGGTGTGEHKHATQPVVPIGGPPDEAFPDGKRPPAKAAPEEEPLLDEEEDDGATSAWVGSGPTRVGGTQPDLPAAAASSPELPKAPPPKLPLDALAPPPAAKAPPKEAETGAPPILAPAFHAPPAKPRSSAPGIIIVLLLAGGAAAGYFVFKDKLKGGGAASTSPTASTEGTPGTVAAPAATAPAENAAPTADAAAAAAAAEKTPDKGTEKPAEKPAGGETTGISLRARPPGEAPKPEEAKPAEAKPSEAKSEEAKSEGKSERGSRRGKRRGGGASEAAAGGEAAPAAEAKPAVADVTPGAAEGAAPAADAPAKQASTSIKISTSPAGAEVIIDGNSVGSTPFTSSDVDPGLPHSITLKKDGFEAHERMISGSDWPKAKGGVRTLKLNVKLRSAGGEAKPAEEAPAEVPPGLGTTPASPKRE